MNRNAIAVAVGGTIFAWLPYLLLQCYWVYLRMTVPGSEHGEISGPVLYFLPRLLAVAILSTLVIAVVCIIVHSKILRTQ